MRAEPFHDNALTISRHIFHKKRIRMSYRLLDPCTLQGWLNRLLNRPYAVITFIGIITLFFLFYANRLSFDTSVYDLIIENIPETIQYQDYKTVFGSEVGELCLQPV